MTNNYDVVVDLGIIPSNTKIWIGSNDAEMVTPLQLLEHLDEYVIGQDEAKKLLAIVAGNHIAIERHNEQEPGSSIVSSNIMLTGPSGSGKTYLLKTLSKKLKRPFMSIDITHYSPSGYTGKSLNSLTDDLLSLCQGDPEQAEQAIVLIDEIDKISTYGGNEAFSSTTIQRELLKMIEGDIVKGDKGIVDTSKILWVFAGSFDKYVTDEAKKSKKNALGFGDSGKHKEKKIVLDHTKLMELGLIRELIGRIGHIAQLNALTQEDFIKILTEVKDAPLKQVETIAKARGINLKITDKDLDTIIEKAVDLGVGARGLRVITEQHFLDQLL